MQQFYAMHLEKNVLEIVHLSKTILRSWFLFEIQVGGLHLIWVIPTCSSQLCFGGGCNGHRNWDLIPWSRVCACSWWFAAVFVTDVLWRSSFSLRIDLWNLLSDLNKTLNLWLLVLKYCRFNIVCILLYRNFLPTASMRVPFRMEWPLMRGNQLALISHGLCQTVPCSSMSKYFWNFTSFVFWIPYLFGIILKLMQCLYLDGTRGDKCKWNILSE